MKKTFFIFVLLILLFPACSDKEEIKLTTAGSNAIAMNIGKGWEVTALTELSGFAQDENNKTFTAKIFYSVDVLTKDGKTLRSIFTKQIDKNEKESISSLKIEAQFNIGPDYSTGKYKAVFNIKDMISNKTTKDTVGFSLD